MEFDEKTLTSEYIYKGKILNLRRDSVTLIDGKTANREVVEHSGGSSVLCELDGKILLVKQFRYPYRETIYELPAGKLNAGETPEETAIRELEEEGGVLAEDVELMFKVYPSPGYTEEIIWIYKAINPTRTKNRLDEDEFLESEWFDKQTLKCMIEKGQINDAKTLIALLRVL